MSEQEAQRRSGVVRRVFNKGYGFISPEGAIDPVKESVYFHASDLQTGMFDALMAGTEVTYEVMPDEQGQRAVKVREVGKPVMPVSGSSMRRAGGKESRGRHRDGRARGNR